MQNEKIEEIAEVVAVGLGLGCCAYKWWQNNKQKSHKTEIVHIEEDLLSAKNIPKKLCLSSETSGIYFGEVSGFSGYIGKSADEDGHCLVIGDSGSGKSTAVFEPTMLRWKGSTVQVIVKGEYKEFVKRRQSEGRRVVVFELDSELNKDTCYDPFLIMEHYPKKAVTYAKSMAVTLCPLPTGNSDAIWAVDAQNFLSGVILYCYAVGMGFTEFLTFISMNPIKGIAEEVIYSGYAEAEKRVLKAYHMEEKQQKSLELELGRLAGMLDPSTDELFINSNGNKLLDWEELNNLSMPIDIVIVVPQDCICSHRPLISLILEQMIETLMHRKERTYETDELPPILVILDEFQALGKIPAFVSGFETLRSRGVTLLISTQTSYGIDEVYGENSRRIIYANCAYKLVLRLSEASDQQYFSEASGNVSVSNNSHSKNVSFSISESKSGLNIGCSMNNGSTTICERRPYIYPDAFAKIDNVVCVTKEGVFKVEKLKKKGKVICNVQRQKNRV